MNWLLHNPLADLRGPDFLALYAAVIIGTLVLLGLYLRSLDPTRSLPIPPVPPKVDPLETAFLRGNRPELIHVLILSLIDRQYLEKTGQAPQISQPKDHPDPRHLSPVEKEIFDQFTTPQNAWVVAKLAAPGPLLDRLVRAYEQKLQFEKLVCPPTATVTANQGGLIAAALILGLGGYKLCVTLARRHHNVGFLIAMGIVGCLVLLFILARAARHPSARGRSYLEKLELAFAKLRDRAGQENPQHIAGDSLLLLAAIFGVSALANTPWKNRAALFRPPRSSASSFGNNCGSTSCGSSCGGGGCGGGD